MFMKMNGTHFVPMPQCSNDFDIGKNNNLATNMI